MINEYNFQRGDFNYKLFIGKDVNGNSIDYLDRVEVDEATGYPVRYFPRSTFIQRDMIEGKGAVEYIETVYIKTLLDSFGRPMPKQNETITFRTNDADIIFFIAGLGIHIMKSNNNGFFRAAMGFNDYKVFDSITGQFISSYSSEELSNPPTFNYYDTNTTSTQ